MKKITLLLLSLISIAFSLQGQVTPVVVTNVEAGDAVRIKWMEETVYSLADKYVFRKEVNATEWTMLNEEPIAMQDSINLPYAEKTKRLKFLERSFTPSVDNSDFPFNIWLLLVNDLFQYDVFAEYLGNFYEDKTAESGKTYLYQVGLKPVAGRSSLGTSKPITVKPFEKMPPPENFAVTIDEKVDSLAKFSWTPDTETYFGVFINRTTKSTGVKEALLEIPIIPSATGKKKGKLVYPEFLYKRGDHELGETYIYEAEVVDFFGRRGQVSESFEVTVIDKSPIPPPARVEVGKKGVREAWIYWTDVDNPNLVGYNIYKASTLDGEYTKVNPELLPPTVSSFDYTIEDFGAHFFKIETVNQVGITQMGNPKLISMVDLEPPVMPANVEIVPDTGKIKITWNTNTEPDLRGYVLFRSVRAGENVEFERITPDPIQETVFYDKLSKRAKNTFYYKIAAVDTLLNMSERTVKMGVKMPDIIPPNQPVLIKAQPFVTSVTLEWLPVMTETDDLVGYEVFRKLKAEETWVSLTSELLSKTTSTFNDTNVKAGLNYQYKIICEDDAGNRSVFSNIYNVRTKPDNTPAEGANKISTNYQKKKNQVTIKWKEDEPDRKGSVVFRKAEGSRLVALSPMINDKAVFVDKKITKGKTYTYLVKTYYNDGKVGASSPEELSISE